MTRLFRRIATITLLLLLAGLAWRIVRYAMGFPIWGDEANVVMSLMTRDYAGMLRPPLDYDQIAPLGFMWTELALARTFGYAEWVLRLPAFVAGMLAFVLFWRFAGKVLDRRAALLAVAIMAASFYPVRHTAEVKPYAIDMLAGLVLTWLAWSVWTRPQSIGRWVALALAAAIAVWFSYPAVFVIGGLGICLAGLAWRRGRLKPIVGLALLGAVAGASFLAMYLIYARPQTLATAQYFMDDSCWADAFPPVARPWLLPWWLLDTHAGNMMAYPIGGKHFMSVLTLVLVIVGSVNLWKSGRKGLLILLLCPLATTFVAAAMQRYPYGSSARVSLFMAPAFCLLAGLGLSTAIRRWMPRRLAPEAIRTTAIVLAAIALVGLTLNVVKPYKDGRYEDTRKAVAELAGRTSPADQWIVMNPVEESKEYNGSASVCFRHYVTRFSPVKAQWTTSPQAILPEAGKIWLLHFSDPNIKKNVPDEQCEAYASALGQRLGPPQRQRYILRASDHDSAPASIMAWEFPGHK